MAPAPIAARALRYVRAVAGLILGRPLVSVVVIPLLPDGRIALARGRDDGLWRPPGGLIDRGETVARAAARELREETGLTLLGLGRLVGVYSDPARDPRIHAIAIVLEARADGPLAPEDRAEMSDARAFALEALDGLAFAHDHARHLADWRAGRTVIA